jgi:hypothetical protein
VTLYRASGSDSADIDLRQCTNLGIRTSVAIGDILARVRNAERGQRTKTAIHWE